MRLRGRRAQPLTNNYQVSFATNGIRRGVFDRDCALPQLALVSVVAPPGGPNATRFHDAPKLPDSSVQACVGGMVGTAGPSPHSRCRRDDTHA